MCHKLTMAGHCPRSPASWTLALHSPSRSLGPLGPVTAPDPAACSSWARSLQFLVSLPVCQSSAVFRIIFLHIVGGEPANLGKDEEVVRAATTLFLNMPDRFFPSAGPLHLPPLPPSNHMPHIRTQLTSSTTDSSVHTSPYQQGLPNHPT